MKSSPVLFSVLSASLSLTLVAADVHDDPALANAFRVTPYVQRPATDAMSILFLTKTNGLADVSWWAVGGSVTNRVVTVPELAPELGYVKACPWLGSGDDSDSTYRYGAWSMPFTTPWQHRTRLAGLAANTAYGYRVVLHGPNAATYENVFRTLPAKARGFRFCYFSDSETEPADNDPSDGLTPDWSDPRNGDAARKYYATQTDCYAANLRTIMECKADLIVMAGDLAQKGSKQVCWDEFWRHNAGPLNDPAGSIPILASPGNHDYWEYRDNGNAGIDKYLRYFEYEPNDVPETELPDPRHRELFHRLDYGPATFLFMDFNNGWDNVPEEDTNCSIWRDAANYPSSYRGHDLRPCPAPDFHSGAPMYRWLERQLADAQRKSAFIFVVCHHCPYSVGYHCRQPGENGEDLTAVPLRKEIVPLLQRHGVTAMLCGHDEMMEHSKVGDMHVWDMGIAGDGLRGGFIAKERNPWQVWRADVDSPEQWNGSQLVDGGKHYGHLEVTIRETANGQWEARFEPVYVFPLQDANGRPTGAFERRVYDDVLTLTNALPTVVVPSERVVAAEPKGLMTTFVDGPDSRGFTWQTDASVSESKAWILEGAFDERDDALFEGKGRLVEGTTVDKTETNSKNQTLPLHLHKVEVTGLRPGKAYSYRIGGAGHYLYGQFTTDGGVSPQNGGKALTLLTFSDAQTRSADKLPIWANTVALASELAGGPKGVDFILSNGDFFDVNYMHKVDATRNNADPSSWLSLAGYDGLAFEMYLFNYFKWGMSADAATPFLRDVPWVMASGNHDSVEMGNAANYVYGFCTAQRYGQEKCFSFNYRNVHFAVLPCLATGDNAALYGSVAAWLKDDLAANLGKTDWTVVMMHWGPYTTGDHGANAETQTLVTMIAPAIAAGHVDLVLQAHDHTFSKTLPYRWDAIGYTTTRDNAAVVNLTPRKRNIGGESYDTNPRGTYYVGTGCSGHRFGDDGDAYASATGASSYAKRTYKVVTGTLAVSSAYGTKGDDASSNPAMPMFGVLKFNGNRMTYDWYLAPTDGGAPILYDTLRVHKDTERRGLTLTLE